MLCDCRDVTGATWGGSTVQSDPEEDETSSTSLPYEVEANVTQDSLLNVTQDSILNVTEDSILNVTEDSILNDAGMSACLCVHAYMCVYEHVFLLFGVFVVFFNLVNF